MPRLLLHRHGIHSGRRPRAPGPTVVHSSDSLISCDWSCPGECEAFYEGLARLKQICLVNTYNEFYPLIRDLEHKLAHEYWSPLKQDIVRCGLTQSESSFLSKVLGDNPILSWRDIGFIPFNGVSNPPVVDYILDQIPTAFGEGEAMVALEYVALLLKLQRSISHVHDDHVYEILRLFHRRYAEAFGTPYQREYVSEELVHSYYSTWEDMES